MRFVSTLLALLSALCTPKVALPRLPDRPPNIISIVTDDQGLWTLGCYGNKDSLTPNMDSLARDGARFTQAFVATPVCSPSRAAFLTGRFGTEVGITDYIRPEEAAEGVGLKVGIPTWPQQLQKAGYRTGLFGKWHLGEKPQFHPTRRGFDVFAGFLQGGRPTMNPPIEVNWKVETVNGATADVVTDQALQFIRDSQGGPFACLIHFREPHLPYTPVLPEDSAPFKNIDPDVPKGAGMDIPQLKQLTNDYYSSIHSVDRNLGRVLRLLKDLKIEGDTIVQFTSDHGYNLGHHRIHTKGNGVWMTGGVSGPKRPNLWDTSLRVPLLLRWPGRIAPGLVVEGTTTNLDAGPTLLGLAGVRLPPDRGNRGMDCSAWLLGRPGPGRDELFLQYDLHNDGLSYMRGLRTHRWKLVKHLRERGMDELYDLSADPDETRNRYGDQSTLAELLTLEGRLLHHMKSIGDPLAGEMASSINRDRKRRSVKP